MPIPQLIGLGLGIGGAIGKMFGRGKANKQMNELLKRDPRYTINPIAQERLGLARTMLNSRAPGAATAEQNIYANQASQLGGLNKNATDASQALALAGAYTGQTNQAFNQLGMQESQDYQRRLGNLTGAQEGMIQEGDKVFNDNVRRFQNEVQIRGAQNANKQNTFGDISNMGFALADFGLSGGFGNMFGGGSTGSPMRTQFNATPQSTISNYQINPGSLYSPWQTPGFVR